MATLEDAAEELVVKLRGLESEIAESDQQLEALRQRVETAKRELDEDWTDLTEAVESLLDKVREEGEAFHPQGDAAEQAVTDAHNALVENAANAQGAIEAAAAELDALGQQATTAADAVEPFVHDGVEAPAQSLADRARELEQELGRLVDEAKAFLADEVAPAIEKVAEEVRERCQEVHRSLAEDHAPRLQEIFDEWSGHVGELEDYVLQQGFVTSRQHAQDVVDYVIDECEKASREHLDGLAQVVGLLEGQLRELATEVERAGQDLAADSGARLLRELDEAKESALRAVGGLDLVRQELAERSFMEG
jgi:uncharacterized coiled-coil DUF342 family protein